MHAPRRSPAFAQVRRCELRLAEDDVSIRELDLILEPGSSIVRSLLPGFRRLAARRVHTFTIVRLRARRDRPVEPSSLRRELATSGGAAVLVESPQR
jgi:hypothetical protein